MEHSSWSGWLAQWLGVGWTSQLTKSQKIWVRFFWAPIFPRDFLWVAGLHCADAMTKYTGEVCGGVTASHIGW